MMAVSLVNLVASAASVVVSTVDPAYPADNVKTPQRPFTSSRTTSIAEFQQIYIDHGSAKSVDVWAVIRTNAASVLIHADDAPGLNSGAGGTPQYASATLPLAEALNGRYHVVHRPPATVTRRYNAFTFFGTPVALPEHAAGASYYVFGGVWAGTIATVPRDVLADHDLERQEPVEDTVLPSGSRVRSLMGAPFLTLTARRQAWQDSGRLDTELRQWLTLDRAWGERDYALVLPSGGGPSDGYIMRRLKGAAWQWGGIYSEGDLTLEECI